MRCTSSSRLSCTVVAVQPSAAGRKRAVIRGISYKNSRHELKGSINDAKCMLYLLVYKFRFPQDSIFMVTEEETDPHRTLTKSNSRRALHWLVQGCETGHDSLVFYFLGHGSQQRNYNGDEVNGYDESICPLDFETLGMIADDEINTTIVRPIPHGVKLHAIVDASHSSTMLDLPFHCNMNRRGQYQCRRSGVRKGTSGGEAICFGGCDDDQESADTSAVSNGKPSGAMTASFIRAIDRGQGSAYGSILSSMCSTVWNSGYVNSII